MAAAREARAKELEAEWESRKRAWDERAGDLLNAATHPEKEGK